MCLFGLQEEELERKKKKERQQLEKRYTLPEAPAIIVHPSTTAKSGKFDCSVMTLSVLLDYRPEDNKEHSYEVGLFVSDGISAGYFAFIIEGWILYWAAFNAGFTESNSKNKCLRW